MSSLGVSILIMALNVVTGTLTARLLGPYGRGELAMAVRWAGLFTMLFTLGLPGAVIYLGKREPEEQREYFAAYLVAGCLTGIAGWVCGELLLPLILHHQPPAAIRLAQLAMFALPLGVVADGLIGTLQTLGLFSRVLWLRIFNETGTLIVIVGLLFWGRYDVDRYILSTIIWSMSVAIVTFVWVCRALPPRVNALFARMKKLFGVGIQVYGGSLVTVFGSNLDQLVISLFLSPYTLGIYSVCVSIAGLVPSLVNGSIQLFLWPKLMDLYPQARKTHVEGFHAALFYASVSAVAILALVLPVLIPLVYGHRYAPAIPIGEILIVGGPIIISYGVLTSYLATMGKFNIVTIAEAVGLACGIGTMFPLSHILGGSGAALGLLVAYSSKWVCLALSVKRSGISLRALFHLHARRLLEVSMEKLRRQRPSLEGEST